MKLPTRLVTRVVTHAIVVLGLCSTAGSAYAQNWVKESNMKVPRVEATTVEYRDDIYVFNGFKPGLAIADSIEKYDAATRQWSIIGSTTVMNDTAMTHNGVVRVGADVWLIGGRVGRHPGRVSNKIWIFNLNNRKWRRGPDMPRPVAAGGAALVNNKIHWFGGLDANARCDVAHHYVYDLNAPGAGWKNSVNMPSPRNHFSTAVVDGVIYAMGGQYGHDNCPGKNTQDTPLVHAFNPDTNKWSQKAGMPNKNSHSEPGTFVYKNEIYTVGGENAKNKVWKYNPRSNKWSTFRTLADDLVAPIARIVDGRLIVAGGGAPIAQQASNTVRSLLVDNNPPVNTEPDPQTVPQPAPQPAPAPTPLPGSGTPERATLISMEAEYFDVSTKTSSHQWTHVALGDSSNDDAMITTPDEGALAGSTDNTPMLSYMVYFNSPGKHYIWVRGLGDTNNAGLGTSDSIQIGLNGTLASTAYRVDQFPAEWTWSRHTPSDPVASLNVVDAGVNMVNFWMREDGLAFDKFVITSDPNFVPTGHGPTVTDGTDDFVAPVIESDDSEAGNLEPVSDNVESDNADTVDSVDQANSTGTEVDNVDVDPTDAANENTASLDTTNDNAVLDDSTNNNPVVVSLISNESDVELPDNSDQADDAISDVQVTTIERSNSSGGLFGGSASTMGLLSLLLFCFVRAGRTKRTD